MALDRPVYAAGTADGTTAVAVALHVAPGSALNGGQPVHKAPLRFLAWASRR